MTDDKWMDEILEKSEKEHIHQKIGYAIECIKNLDVSEALETLEMLTEELGTNVEQKWVDREQKEVNRVKSILESLGLVNLQQHYHGRGAYTYTESDFVRALRQEFEELRRAIHNIHQEQREILYHFRGRNVSPPLRRDRYSDPPDPTRMPEPDGQISREEWDRLIRGR